MPDARYIFGEQLCLLCGARQDAYWPVELAGSSRLECSCCRTGSAVLNGIGHLVTVVEQPALALAEAYDLSRIWLEDRQALHERQH